MNASIIPYPQDRCASCEAVRGLERHHIFYGTSNRQLSEEDGLTVMLCHLHHRGQLGVHHGNRQLDQDLKEIGQYIWMKHYGRTAEDFIRRYGKNYL